MASACTAPTVGSTGSRAVEVLMRRTKDAKAEDSVTAGAAATLINLFLPPSAVANYTSYAPIGRCTAISVTSLILYAPNPLHRTKSLTTNSHVRT